MAVVVLVFQHDKPLRSDDSHCKFFMQLPTQRGYCGFSRLALATGEFPAARHVRCLPALADQDIALRILEQADNDLNHLNVSRVGRGTV